MVWYMVRGGQNFQVDSKAEIKLDYRGTSGSKEGGVGVAWESWGHQRGRGGKLYRKAIGR